MHMSRRTLLRTSAAITAASSIPFAGCTTKVTKVENSLLTQATDMMLNAYPESASSAGIDHGKYSALKSKLTDRSYAGQMRIKNDVRSMLTKLKKVDTTTLPADEALNIDVVKTVFETTSEGFDFNFGDVALLNSNWSYRNSPYAIAQNTGSFVEIPSFLDSSHSIKTTEDADAYLSRMEAFAKQLDGETERSRLGSEQDIILPDFLIKKTLGQLRTTHGRSSDSWGIVSSLASSTAKLGGDYEKKATNIADQYIRPAIERQIAALEKQTSRATSNAGVWAMPEGEAYYAWALKAGTTTTMSPNEVHQMGLDELASIQGEMDPILKSIGYTRGSIGDRMIALSKDPAYQFSKGDKGRKEILTFIDDTLADIRKRMPQAFETLVPGFLEVTRIAPEVEAGAPGAYGGAGSIDGKKPGHFWINLRTTALHSKYSLADLTYHEAIPGHVWQGEYTFKQPLIRSLLAFNAYSEGWALYAEQLADELGVFETSPVGRLGYLQSLAFRACRLVVDTGLHAKQWTREEAVNWFVTNNGSNPEEVRSEVDRYCAWPGQACGYKVGHSAIVNLRKKAKSTLGTDFDFKRFNDAVVLGGSVPMTVLNNVIDDYIAREKSNG